MKLARKNRYIVPLALGAICFSQWLPHLRASDTDGGSYGEIVTLPPFTVVADPVDDGLGWVNDFDPGYFDPFLDDPDSNGGGAPEGGDNPDPSLGGIPCSTLKDKGELALDVYRKVGNNYQAIGFGSNVPISATNAVQLANGDPATLAAKSDDPASGFHAAVYVNTDTGKVTVAFAGTEGAANDILTDVANGLSIPTTQYEKAMDLAHYVKDTFGDNVEFVGHSLGGGLATAASAATGLGATTFNSAGVSESTVQSLGGSLLAAGPIAAVSVSGEVLTTFQDVVNTTVGASLWLSLTNTLPPPPAIGQRIFLAPADPNAGAGNLHRMVSVLAALPC